MHQDVFTALLRRSTVYLYLPALPSRNMAEFNVEYYQTDPELILGDFAVDEGGTKLLS